MYFPILKGTGMRKNIGWSCIALFVLALGIETLFADPANTVTVDFEKVKGKSILNSAGKNSAQLLGEAKISAEAKNGAAALDLGGPDSKGVASFGKQFALSKQGTIELWCKPRTLSGIFVGKYGAINIEFVKAKKFIRAGIKLKQGPKGTWVSCNAPSRSAKANQWVKVKVSWGAHGLLLFLDDKLVGKAELPEKFDWFSETGNFVLGSYTWPPSYAVWFFDGLIDDFSFKPTQEPPPAGAKLEPVKLPATPKTRPIVLKLLLKKTPKPNYGAPVPDKISGKVSLNTAGKITGAEGVSVTDGFSVVKTNAQGGYTLSPNPKAIFINITRPSGYDVDGDWYKPLAAQVDFALKPAPDENEYTFINVSDTHTSTHHRSLEGLSEFVREVNAMTPAPRFVLNNGDLVNLSKALTNSPATGHAYFRNYTGILNHLTMPYYNVAGDHTDSSYRLKDFPRGDFRCGKPMFWEYLGPNLFSFEYGKIHFMSLDFVYHLGKKQIRGIEYPSHTIQPVHVEWMKQDMANRTKGSYVVTASEKELALSYSGVIEVAKQNDIRLQLIGDDHIVAYKKNFIPHRIAGALSGCWWNTKSMDLCPDLEPRGYEVYRVSGEKIERFTKGLGQRVKILSPRLGKAVKGRFAIKAHIVQPKPNEALLYTLNGKDWKPMSETGRPFYRAVFEATADSTSLADGIVNLQIKSSLTGEIRARDIVAANNNVAVALQNDAVLSFIVGKVRQIKNKAPVGKVEVIFNDKVIGAISPNAHKKYSFTIPSASLKTVNILHFRFAFPEDGMGISHLVLNHQGKTIRDPWDIAVKKVKVGHWGEKSADWGGYIIGDGDLFEGPFTPKQDEFCFVMAPNTTASKPSKNVITIWKELEELLPASGWAANGYRPAKFKKKEFWTGKSAVRSDGRAKRPLVWRFKLKEEMTADGIDQLVRTYAVWIHQYGYKSRQLSASLDGRLLGTISSRNTETFDKKGKYVAAGHYIWQKLGEVTMAGGDHKIALQPAKGQNLLLNALVLTTDKSLTPEYHELMASATKGFATSAPTKWAAYIEASVDVYGLTPGFTSMSWFAVGHSGKKATLFDKDAVAVITLPEGIELMNASQRLVGVNWAYPKAPFKDWNRVTIKKKSVLRNGKPFTQYAIGLSYLPRRGRHDLMLYLRTTLKPGSRTRIYTRMQWKGGQSGEQEVAYKVVDIPKTKGFRNIVIGSAGGSWDYVHPAKWPDYPELVAHSGLNAVALWGICGKERPDMKLRQDTIREFLGKGVQTLDEFSPWYSAVMPPKTIEDGAAADIAGKLYKDYKNRTIPCPTYIEGNPHIEKQLDHVRTFARLGITGMTFDDERFNLKGTGLCFCPRCKTGYRAYLKKTHPDLQPVDLVKVVRQEKKYPKHYEAWLIFRAKSNSLRLAKMHRAFMEATAKYNHKSVFGDPFTAVLVSPGSAGDLRKSRESQLWDWPSLAQSSVYVCPMIYPTKSKYLPGTIKTLRNIRKNMGGKGRLWVTLNCGYSGGGAILEQNKDVIQYGTLEALMNGCKGVTYWNGYGTHDPLSLQQIAAAVRIIAPYEELLLKGDVMPAFAACADDEVNLSAIADGNRALLLVSNYSKDPKQVMVKIAGNATRNVIDARTGKTIAQLSKNRRSFAVSFKTSRANLFYLSAP
jgi:N terminal of Calcineurin-like phosphoesterase/Concanavalin A-like lectin/glucanases superfamily